MTQPQAGPVQRTKIKYVVSIGEKSLSKVTLLTVSKPALDGFLSTVDRNGTGTGRNSTGTGKLSYRFAPIGSRFLPFFKNRYSSKIYRFYRSFNVKSATFSRKTHLN